MSKKRTPTIKIAQEDVKTIMKTAGGTIFNVVFVKKNHDIRSLTGRFGVKKNLKGGINTTAHIPEYMTVYEVGKTQYRHVHAERVKEFSLRGHKYVVG